MRNRKRQKARGALQGLAAERMPPLRQRHTVCARAVAATAETPVRPLATGLRIWAASRLTLG